MSGNNSNHHNTESHTLIENEADEQSKNDGITSKAGILHQRCMELAPCTGCTGLDRPDAPMGYHSKR